MKRYSKVLVVLLLMALPLAVLGCSAAELPAAQPVSPAETTSMRTISVPGSGQATGTPDKATVTIGVETEATTASDALSRNSAQMQQVINSLHDAGVSADNLQTQTVQLQPRYQQPSPQTNQSTQPATPAIVGYVATNTIQVTTTNIAQLGQLLDTAIQAGGNRIQGISFEIENSSDLLDQARRAAWEDALSKAEQLASLAGVQLGQVQTINETSITPRPIVQRSFAGVEQVAVPVEAGTQTVQIDLNVTWALQ